MKAGNRLAVMGQTEKVKAEGSKLEDQNTANIMFAGLERNLQCPVCPVYVL
jgi:hypothetical protein